MRKKIYSAGILMILILISNTHVFAQRNPYRADPGTPGQVRGMKLVWSDEFNVNGKPNPAFWKFENGFTRNEELQWYQPENAYCKDGLLVIEARRDTIPNPNYVEGSSDWRKNRKYAYYSSASIKTPEMVEYQFGRIEVRARIDTTKGSWPAIWTLGTSGGWPFCGEVDIMEFYRIAGVPTILANVAWGSSTSRGGTWDNARIPLTHFLAKDPDWSEKFHVWRMDWNKDSICLYLDDELLNVTTLDKTINPIAPPVNPFLQKHYFLLNLAIGANGGNPEHSKFPFRYEVDYIRIYQKIEPETGETLPDSNKSGNVTGSYMLPGKEIKAMAEKILYKTTPQEDMYLYLLRPDTKNKKALPAIVYFTGGGWVNGTVEGQIPNAAWFRDKGIIGIDADYRVKSRHGTTPLECIRDAKSAIRFIRAHARELGIDPRRIIAAGGSAGGHIAACTAIEGGDETDEDLNISSKPNALVLHNPVLGEGFGKDFFAAHPEFSPILQVKKGWPPTIISNGTNDRTTPFDAAEKFTLLMRKAGNACELIPVKDAGHSCDWPVTNPNFLPNMQKMFQFLKSQKIIK